VGYLLSISTLSIRIDLGTHGMKKHMTWRADGRNIYNSRSLKGQQACAEVVTELECDAGIPVWQQSGLFLLLDGFDIAGCF